jgi:hypothetical protein
MPRKAAEPQEHEALADYLARIEKAAQPLPVCQVTHPDAIDGNIHQGTYAGIRLVKGDTVAALLSDGSTI